MFMTMLQPFEVCQVLSVSDEHALSGAFVKIHAKSAACMVPIMQFVVKQLIAN